VKVAALLVALGCACAPAPKVEIPIVSKHTSGPLELRLPRYPDGLVHDLAQDRGNVVLLDVWATWCDPCREALPGYQKLVDTYGSQGLRVYAMNVDEDASQVDRFVQSTGLRLAVLLDTGALAAEQHLGIERLPTTLILDKRGIVRSIHRGFGDGSLARYRREIESLLNEPYP
jgi:thiol-disulfide isomerase/thioredoxin